jgi:Protein of unknown function (DUF3562)
MNAGEPLDVVREIARATNTDEETVSRLYAEALESYRQDARIHDYISLFAAKRIREALRERSIPSR